MEKVENIIAILRKQYPEVTTALKHENPFQLLISTILSARTTDKIVNQVTPMLFARYPTPEKMANADLRVLQKTIRSTGFYRNKAKNIQKTAKILDEQYGGEVPSEIDELTKLPGVARKTANVVLGHAFDKNQGIPVDTHVMRLAPRLGLTEEEKRGKIERDLMDKTPKKHWTLLSDLLIQHGRKVCKPRNPLCEECVLNELCPSAFTFEK